MTEKLDLKKSLKQYYSSSAKEPIIVNVPSFNFMMIDGHGNPNTALEYQEAVSVLYQFSYALKFFIKKSKGIDYAVMPLEGLWWIKDGRIITMENKEDWDWIMMIAQPEFIDQEMIERTRNEIRVKKNPPALERVIFESFHEGKAVQILHIGPYVEEKPNIERMHTFAIAQGYSLHGKHHEIYLGDPNKTAPERLKTILRQPITL